MISGIQQLVHNLEQGGLARIIRRVLFVVAAIALILFQLFVNFKGLSHPLGMEQAQISREIARGKGWSTKSIRPLAIWQIRNNGKTFQKDAFPDTYHAPLPTLINAVPLRLFRSQWRMTPDQLHFFCDRVIAVVSISFFLAGLVISYFTARRLFDARLASICIGLVLICDLFWKFSLSGLPQMLMFLLLSCALYAMLRAVEAEIARENTLLWQGAAGIGFGLLALTHAITMWLFLGLLIFAVLFFRKRFGALVILVGGFVVVYAPWMVRNFLVCGNPAGVAMFTVFGTASGSELTWMRSIDPPFSEVTPRLLGATIRQRLLSGGYSVVQDLGWCVPAIVFVVALLHPFKRPHAAAFKWCVALLWIAGFFGVSVFGGQTSFDLSSNNVSVILVPVMSFFGMAFLLVLWSRAMGDNPLFRNAFLLFIFLFSGIPFIFSLVSGRASKLHWPPYVPPYIAILGNWTAPSELICSDVPTAVSWYADRRCLWMPESPAKFVEMSDWNELGGRIVGLYLTPATGHQGLFNKIVFGEFREWAPFILRTPQVRNFPLRAAIPLPLGNQCIFYADQDRWSRQGGARGVELEEDESPGQE